MTKSKVRRSKARSAKMGMRPYPKIDEFNTEDDFRCAQAQWQQEWRECDRLRREKKKPNPGVKLSTVDIIPQRDSNEYEGMDLEWL